MKTLVLLISSLSLLFISCKNDPKIAIPPALKNTDLNIVKHTQNATFNNPKNILLYQDYLAIKAAMVNTNYQKTEDAAKKMGIDFKTDNNYKLIHQVASLMASAENIQKQREFFVGLTEETLKILKSDLKNGQFFVQYCPMAFEGKGAYWMSNSNEIRNPYFGDLMLTCGETTEILK